MHSMHGMRNAGDLLCSCQILKPCFVLLHADLTGDVLDCCCKALSFQTAATKETVPSLFSGQGAARLKRYLALLLTDFIVDMC